jgi:enoyl-CoA hydratase/carnithine racemase
MPEILLEIDKAIATVTLSNPGKLNALTLSMWKSLAQKFQSLSQDESLRCVVIRGAGGHFAAGADIQEFPAIRNTLEQVISYHMVAIKGALDAITHCMHPTVAAIEGSCIGGGLEIACACDLRIASQDARFGIPINRLGFPLAPHEMHGLLELAGKATVLEMLLEGQIFNAREAKEKGLLNRIADHPVRETYETAQRIAENAPLAARMNKKILRRVASPPPSFTEHELKDIFSFSSSADHQEGIQSFLEKRRPSFSGK